MAGDSWRSESTSITLQLPSTITLDVLELYDVVLLQRQYILQVQDWSTWLVVVNTTTQLLCLSECYNYTVTDLQPSTQYQFSMALASIDLETQPLVNLDILEIATMSVGV